VATFLREFLESRGIDSIMLFGDTRTYHRHAIELCQELGIKAFVFEEGYVRPDYVTMEQGGVNANSTLPKSLEAYSELGANPRHQQSP
jgi:capsular polysaccharide export protein